MSFSVTDEPVIREFRITLPMTLEECRIGHLYTTAEYSKDQCGGGEGVEVIADEPFAVGAYGHCPPVELKANGQTFTKGQYTHKVIHLATKAPSVIRALGPKGSVEVHEASWNAFPYVHTMLTNPDYMKDGMLITIDTFYYADDGKMENILGLAGRDLSERVVEHRDIANDRISSEDYNAKWDPCLVGSAKTGRSPLPKDGTGEWKQNVKPVMTCYKVVKVLFKWWGLQEKVQEMIMKAYREIFLNFHRRLVCSIDEFYGLTIENIREHEKKTKEEMEKLRFEGEARGMKYR